MMVSRYPSTYTPSSTGTCVFTISKVSSEVCQVSKILISFDCLHCIVPAPSWLWDNVGIRDNNGRCLYWQFHCIRCQSLFFLPAMLSIFFFAIKAKLEKRFPPSVAQTPVTTVSLILHMSSLYDHFHFPSVCWVWGDLNGHNLVDAHAGRDHLHPQVEHLGPADPLHRHLQVCYFGHFMSYFCFNTHCLLYHHHRIYEVIVTLCDGLLL